MNTFKLNLKSLFFISFVLMFLPAFVIYLIPGTHANFEIGLILFLVIFCIAILFNYKTTEKFCRNLLELPVVKIYLLFILFAIINIFYNVFRGMNSAPIYYYLILYFRSFLFWIVLVFLPSFGVLLNIRYKQLIKIFYFIVYLILLIGIIQYIAIKFNIVFLYRVIELLSNARAVGFANPDLYIQELRVFSVFFEPSGFGQFMAITLPFIVNIVFLKVKLFKNTILNLIFKKTFLLLLLLNLVLTKSPIYFAIVLGELILLLIFKYKKTIIKQAVQLLGTTIFCVFIICFIINTIAIDSDIIYQSFLKRIIYTFDSIGDFNLLLQMEPSLATRIIAYYNQLRIFIDNIYTGVGLGNMQAVIGKYYCSSNLPLTRELIINYFAGKNMATAGQAFVYTTLAEQGLIGFSLFSLYIYYNYKNLKNICKKCNGITQEFVFSLQQAILVMIFLSFYNFSFATCLPFIFLGLNLMTIVYYKQNKLGAENEVY